MRISDTLLPEWDQEMANTRKTLSRVPTEKFGWKPHEKSFSMGALAGHIANMTSWATMTVEEDSFDVAPVEKPHPKPPSMTTTDELLAEFDKGQTAARKALDGATDEVWMKSWSLKQAGNTIFAMPKVAVFRGMVMNHIIHHRGQLTVYLRENNIPVPALYGPSADEQS